MFAPGVEVTDWELLKKFNGMALINVYTQLMSSIGIAITMIFSGNMGDERIQTAVGIGNSLTFIFLITACGGSIRGLDTLQTAAYGVGDMYLNGVYLNRARFFCTLCYVPLALGILIFADPLCHMFTKDEVIISYTKDYLHGMVPAVYFMGLSDAQKRWLINMKITHVAAISNTVTLPVHIGCCYVFTISLGMGIAGLGYACMVSAMFVYCLLLIQTAMITRIRESVFLPNMDTYRGLKPFVAIGIKMICIMMAFVLALEARLIFAGQLGDSEVAATAAMVNISYSIQTIGQGVQISNIALFGNLLGENQP